MKRVLSLVLVVVMLFSMAPVSFAASDEATAAADALYDLGLFQGTGTDANGNPIYDLDRAPTRNEAVTMLVRLLGKDAEAKAGDWDIPFTDVASWAKPYVGYAYANGLTSGTSATTFGGNAKISASQYITFVLRALGYSSGTDFQWNKAWELSDTLGFTNGEYNASSDFTRGDVAEISYNALSAKLKGQNKVLLDTLNIEDKPAVEEPETPAVPEEPVEQPPVVPEKADDGLQGTWVHDASFRIIEYTFDGYNFYRATAQGRDWDAVLYGAGTYSLEGSNLILNHTQDFNIDNMQITRAGGLSQWNLPITNATANEITINGLVYTKKTDAPAYPTYAKIADAYSPDNYKDCYEGTIIKTLTAVTGAECTGSYEGVTDFDPISKSYVAGCPRYAYDIDILECRSEHFEPYIEYLDSVGTRVGSDASSYGSNDKYQIYSNEYTYWVGFDRITVRYSSSSFTYRSWITVYIE